MDDDPFQLFESWYEKAGADARPNRDAMALATATAEGLPSLRMVYFRGLREGGFSFFTNYESRKGRELTENPFAAIVFYWDQIGRQLRVEGRAERLSPEESDRYFSTRPFQSQISAMLSQQSRILPNETEFFEALDKAETSLKGQRVARPENWGGFTLVPSRFEFWTRGEHRRHRRVVYEKHRESWIKSSFYP